MHIIVEYLQQQHVIIQALLATLFTWFITAMGATVVFFTKTFSQKLLDCMLGLAAGIMIAASYWSLLSPAIEMSDGSWIPATVGFLVGGLFLFISDKIIPHLHPDLQISESEGVKTSWHRSILLVSSITLHNIPEGLAIGVAFGAAAVHKSPTLTAAGVALALGIGIQNFPEGLAVSVPLRREGMGRMKAFMYGQASGIVEPMAGVVGAAFVLIVTPLLPYTLAFAAGAMIFVVTEELIPEAQHRSDNDLVTLSLLLGFAIMMLLDVSLSATQPY